MYGGSTRRLLSIDDADNKVEKFTAILKGNEERLLNIEVTR